MSMHTISVLVEDRPGVLARISGLFSRRGFNIDSLAVGPTEDPGRSRMTIVVDCAERPLEQVTKQLNKLVHVLKIIELEPDRAVERELVLVKVKADPSVRYQIIELAEMFRAKIVDVGPDALTIEATGSPAKVPPMPTIYYDDDADLGLVQSRKVAVLGYGSQGHAHALSLHDSGCEVRVGLAEGSKSRAAAEAAGLTVTSPAASAAWADLIMVLVPDTVQRHLYTTDIAPNLHPGDALFFAHGFNIHFGYIEVPDTVDVAMVAPKGPGHLVRRQFENGQGTPVLVAVAQDATGKAWDLAKSYARAIGGTRAGALVTTFQEETETDLFGEQAVLCGGATALVQAGFETLVKAGYQPEVAYFECLHELKLIVDLMYEGGLAGMRYSVSDTAEYGDYSRGPRIINDDTKAEMGRILAEIQSGSFAREWVKEDDQGRPNFTRMREAGAKHPIEQTGKPLRRMMSWLRDKG